MNTRKLTDLPIPQSGCGNIRLVSDGVSLLIEYEFRADGRDWIGGIKFDSVLAHRFRNEMHSRGYASEAYESIAVIEPSTWKQELRAIAPKGVDDIESKKHFAAFLSSNGYFEIMAENYALIEPRDGMLE